MGNRRSIRYFDPDKPVEKEKIQYMLEAMNRASRAVNADFVKAVVVYRDELDPDVLEQLKTPTTTADIDLAPVHIFCYLDMTYTQGAQDRLKELVQLGALNPSHGWSEAYVDEVVRPAARRTGEGAPPHDEGRRHRHLGQAPDAHERHHRRVRGKIGLHRPRRRCQRQHHPQFPGTQWDIHSGASLARFGRCTCPLLRQDP